MCSRRLFVLPVQCTEGNASFHHLFFMVSLRGIDLSGKKSEVIKKAATSIESKDDCELISVHGEKEEFRTECDHYQLITTASPVLLLI